MKFNPKVVFDTSIYLSAIIFGGNPRTCLELARSGEITLFSSRAILLEFAEKLRQKFLWEEEDIHEAIEGFLVFVALVDPQKNIKVIKGDPKDNRILECALKAKADYIISGDKKHLLALKIFKTIPILSAQKFLADFYRS